MEQTSLASSSWLHSLLASRPPSVPLYFDVHEERGLSQQEKKRNNKETKPTNQRKKEKNTTTYRFIEMRCSNKIFDNADTQYVASAMRIMRRAMGIMRTARDVDQYPQVQPDGNRGREAENADQDASTRGVKWEKQTGCPREYMYNRDVCRKVNK